MGFVSMKHARRNVKCTCSGALLENNCADDVELLDEGSHGDLELPLAAEEVESTP